MARSLFYGALGFMLVSGFVGCTIVNYPNQTKQTAQKSQLESRQIQEREVDTNDMKLVMKAVLNTLQDDGFSVKNAVVDLGLLIATKEITLSSTPSRNTNDTFWDNIFRETITRRGGKYTAPASTPQEAVRTQNVKQIEATVNCSEYGKRTKVRASFQARILDQRGELMETYPIDDPKFYQDFFMKVDKGVFIQKQKL